MCGITGFVDCNDKIKDKSEIIDSMMNAINHRGPDSQGFWKSNDLKLFLGHLRLSIIDLSSGGHQPMHSHSDRYVISYNGEIYNYRQIKNELKSLNVNFKSSSDTEVILAAIDTWGINESILKFEGMFAISLYDKRNKNLYLIRDRIGEKPLYYGYENEVFYFSSEIKSFFQLPNFDTTLSNNGLNDFINFSFIPHHSTIFKNVHVLKAGSILKINVSSGYQNLVNSLKEESYWKPIRKNFTNFDNIDKATDYLERRLNNVIKNQMISDVPLGVFLSGGIDSSIVTSLMQEISENQIKTFTIGFEDKIYDESTYSKKVASYLGTSHYEKIISNKDVLNLATNIAKTNDQPFGDMSSIPTKLVSDFAKEHVTVCLTGDAGDELFCGYDRYSVYDKFYNTSYRELLSSLTNYLPSELIEKITSKIPVKQIQYITSRRIKKFNSMISREKGSRYNYYSLLFADNDINEQNLINTTSDLVKRYDLNNSFYLHSKDKTLNHLEYIMNEDIKYYLPDDILYKVDRAAMSTSLETRIPFLDHQIVEFSQNLPLKYKFNGNKKLILKNLLKRKMPSHLFLREKQGFGVPMQSWIQGNLKEWVLDTLSEEELKKTNIFSADAIKSLVTGVIDNKNQKTQLLWNVIQLQDWMRYHSLSV
tara:strand:- start:14069 stop:16015 length:1947 start_codon:yes stop_codon:yes gene_type:complete